MGILGKTKDAIDAMKALAETMTAQGDARGKQIGDFISTIEPLLADTLGDIHELIEAVPEQWKPLAHAILSATGAGERTVMRVSELVQAYRAGVHLEIDMLPISGGGTKFKGTVTPNG